MKKVNPELIGSFINKYREKDVVKDGLHSAKIITLAQHILEVSFKSDDFQVISFNDGKLIIKSCSSIVKNSLLYNKQNIIETINKEIKSNLVKNLMLC